MHEHYDAAGIGTGHTVVTRESLWDDSARARAIALIEHEQSLDRRTGLPAAEAYKEQAFVVEDVTNYAEVAIERRRKDDEAEAKKDRLPDDWAVGRDYIARPATPEDLREAERG